MVSMVGAGQGGRRTVGPPQQARAAGLLTPQALDRLLTDALRRQEAADSLLSIAERVAAAGIEPMSMEEINTEVKAARAQRRQRAGGH